MTDAAKNSLAVLRDPSQFGWWVAPILVLAIYVYAVEIERRNWNAVLGGLALWGMDWLYEICNALVLKATGVSALWTCAGRSAFLIFTGLNLEISLMFAFLGIVAIKMLPTSRETKVLGVPNRIFFIFFLATLAVIIEILLNLVGALVWHYWWWSRSFPFLIIVVAYGSLMAAAILVYDLPKLRTKLIAVGTLYGINLLCVLIFGVALGWI
jgi:hypothetical protein